VNAIGSLGVGDLPPVADVEVMDGQSGGTLVANLATWANVIKARLGVRPMIYSAPGFWDPLPSTGQFATDTLWVANWQVNCPNTPTPWGGWTFWQYADNGRVPGIGAVVDLDEFNGTRAALGQIGGAPYAAQYVSQSFPLATTALTMVEGQTIPSYIELKNVGSKAWDSKTRLGTTQPRDRSSAFADGTWIGANRAAAVTGTMPPGATFKFHFDLHAPDAPGTYHEYFNLEEEGVAWFSDPGQGGPPDNDLEVQVQVVAPQYRGTFKDQSFPLAPTARTAHQGDVVDGYIELTNSGTQPWKAGTTKLAPIPRDQPSPFADASWLAPVRVATVAADVAPGAVGRFDVKLDAKSLGDFQVEFGLVEEGVTWFADPTAGGGPADGFLRVHLVVVPQSSPLDGGAPPAMATSDAGPPPETEAGVPPEDDAGVQWVDPRMTPQVDDASVSGDDATAASEAWSPTRGKSGGCALSAGMTGDPASLFLLAGGFALVAARRRSTRHGTSAASPRRGQYLGS
jgi:hypothetical protein